MQYNDGFRTELIGTPEQIAERIAAYRKRGVDLILGGFLHFQEEVEYFGADVLPLVREIEAAEADSLATGADLRLADVSRPDTRVARAPRRCASVGGESRSTAADPACGGCRTRSDLSARVVATTDTGEVMTYSPGCPGYSGHPPGSYGATVTVVMPPTPIPGPSKLPLYLDIAVVRARVSPSTWPRFGPVFTASRTSARSASSREHLGILLTLAAVLAALLAGVACCPRRRAIRPSLPLLAVLGVPGRGRALVNRPQAATIGWALWVVLALVILQAIAAVLVLLLRDGCAHRAGAQTQLRATAVRPVRAYSRTVRPAVTTTSRPTHPAPDSVGPPPGAASRLPAAVRPAVTRRARRPAGLPAGTAGAAASRVRRHRPPDSRASARRRRSGRASTMRAPVPTSRQSRPIVTVLGSRCRLRPVNPVRPAVIIASGAHRFVGSSASARAGA